MPVEPGIGRNDAYGGNLIPGYEFNHSMARSWEIPVPQGPQPQIHGGYMMVCLFNTTARNEYSPTDSIKPSVQYNQVGQGRINYTHAGYGFATNQFSDPTGFLTPLLSGTHTAPNNQGPFPVWRLSSGWVSYAVEDELHVTIALKRIPSA